jgi:Protein of unknown function (DUF2510)
MEPMAPDAPSPPRGWYPDPGGGASWRWWDGERWSEQLEPWWAPDPELAGLADEEARARSTLVGRGLWLLVVASLLSALLSATSLDALGLQVRWLGRALRASVHGQGLPVQPTVALAAWQAPVRLVELAFVIVGAVLLLRYQHRAAQLARRLGLGARPSPGLGVGGWFIPVANLWLPLRAWLHLVPPRSALRGRIWLAWVALLIAAGSSIGVALASAWSVGAARILVGSCLAGELVALGILRGLVAAIGEVLGSAVVDERPAPDVL